MYRGTVDDEGETEFDVIGELEGTMDGTYGEVNWAASLVAEVGNTPIPSSGVTSWQPFPSLAFHHYLAGMATTRRRKSAHFPKYETTRLLRDSRTETGCDSVKISHPFVPKACLS
jgi:hypothetical protein